MANSRKSASMAQQAESPRSTILYAGVAQGTAILAECVDEDPGFAAAMAESLASLPPMHKRVTFSTNNRLACFLIQPPMTYCGVFDQGFGKELGFAFLIQLQAELKRLLFLRGLCEDRDRLQDYNLGADFAPVMRNAIGEATGKQWYESDQSFDDSVPLMSSKTRLERRMSSSDGVSSSSPMARGKSGKHKQYELREVVMEKSDDMLPVSSMETSSGGAGGGGGKNGNGRTLMKKKFWCCNVKFILAVDAVACVVLLTVWLAVCKGFRCS